MSISSDVTLSIRTYKLVTKTDIRSPPVEDNTNPDEGVTKRVTDLVPSTTVVITRVKK